MPVEPTIQAEVALAIETFRWNVAEYERLIRMPVMGDLVRRAIRVEAQAKHNASQAPMGPGMGSPPGHGPAVRTGRLRASITWRPGQDALSPYVDIGSAVHYAPYVELGTSRMAARPFLRPALEAARVSF